MRSGVVAGLAASALVLTGCAAAPAPASLTPAEIDSIIDEQNQQWWNSMFPDEPMPVVESIERTSPLETSNNWDLVTRCIADGDLPGVTVHGSGDSISISTNDSVEGWSMDQFMRLQFACSLAHPYEPANIADFGMYSDEQFDYLDTYFRTNLTPCLRANGFSVSGVPSREQFLSTAPYLSWTPYDLMTPVPETMEAWALIDLRCPPPAVAVQSRRLAVDVRGY